MDSKKSPLDFFRTALLIKGRGDGRPARERDWCGKVTDELPRLAPPRAVPPARRANGSERRPCPSLRRRAGVSPAGEKLSISGETPELHPTPSKFFQNSATPFHALLALFLLLAATFPAFAQIPSKVTLSRANTPTADGFTVNWSDLSNETAYHLEHTNSANFTTSTLITNISANATSHALTGLTPGNTYYVRVRGAAAGGNGTWSNVQANQLVSIDPGQTRYLSVAGIPHGASHSVNFTISDIFGSANAAGLAAGTTASEASTILLLGSDGSTAHTVFYNLSQNQWREGDTSKGSEIVGFGKGFMVKNNTSSADIFLLSGAASLNPGTLAVFDAGAPAGRLSLLSTSKATPTALTLLGLVLSDNTTTGLKRATTAKDADLILIPDNNGGLKRYHFDGTNWRSGLRAVSDPATVSIPAGGAFFLRKASGSSFEQWTPPRDGISSPLEISGCVAWFDFSDISTMFTDTAGTSVVSADGDAIARINDKSSGGYNLTQSTSNNRPVYKTGIQNSLSVGRFDGSNDALVSSSNFSIQGSSSRTIFTVFKRDDSSNRIIVSWGTNSVTGAAWSVTSEYGLRLNFVRKLYANDGANGSWSLASVRFSGTTSNDIEMFFDRGGVATATENTSGPIATTAGVLRLGQWVDSSVHADGDLAEVIIYDSALSDSDRESVRDYLNIKWGVY